MVQNSLGVPSDSLTPFFTDCAWRMSAMLQGAASFQVDTTLTKGLAMSDSVIPIA